MKKIKAKKRTLDEFKNWLEGLSEFQPDDWVPSNEQWEHIKASIAVIKEPEIIESTVSSIEQPVRAKTYVQPVQSSLDVNHIPMSPGINQHIDMRKPQAIKQDIDTSDGNYTSDFE